MELADVWVQINTEGSNVQLKRITPAQAIVIRSQFGVKVEGDSKPLSPITHMDINAKAERTKSQEYDRLTKHYGSALIKGVFPGESPNMPLTFSEAGVEATEDEKAPKKGPEQVVLPLAELDPKEVQDEESVKDAEARLAQEKRVTDLQLLVKQQGDQIAQLLGHLTKQATPIAPVVGANPVLPAAPVKTT